MNSTLRIPFALWLGMAFTLPLLSFPSLFGAGSQTLRISVLALVTGGLFLVWFRQGIVRGSFLARTNLLLAAAGLFLCVTVASALFSASQRFSLFGSAIEAGGLLSALVLFGVLFLSFQLIQRRLDAVLCSGAFVCGVIAWIVIEALRYGLGGSHTFIDNGLLIGSVQDASVFLGAAILLALPFLRSLSGGLLWSGVALLLLLVAAFLLVASFGAAAAMAGTLLGYCACIFVAYPEGKRRFLVPLIALVCISVGSIAAAQFLAIRQSVFQSNPVSGVVLSGSAERSVLLQTLAESPLRALLGTGPDTFRFSALRMLPGSDTAALRNGQTSLSHSFFERGSTMGLLGLFTLLVLIGLFVVREGKKLWQKPSGSLAAAYFATVYVLLGIYVSGGLAVCVAGFMFIGMTAASSPEIELPPAASESLSSLSRLYANALFLALFIVYVLAGFFLLRGVGGSVAAERAALFMRQGESATALPYARRAAALSFEDYPFRQLSFIQQAEAARILAQALPTDDPRNVRYGIQKNLEDAVVAAQEAVDRNLLEYRNWRELGRAYLALARAFPGEDRKNAGWVYDRALTLNPEDPSLLLERAEVASFYHAHDDARSFAEKALSAASGAYPEAQTFLKKLR